MIRFTLAILCFISTLSLSAQLYNPLYPKGTGSSSYENFEGNYDYEQFLLQNQQSQILGQDSAELARRQIQTDPIELRKLGVPETVIEELTRLNSLQDSLTFLGYQIEQSREENDSLGLEDIKAMIEFQKSEIIRKVLALPPSIIYGQEFFRKNIVHLFDQDKSRIKANEDYILGNGDEISINVWGNREVSEKFVIDGEGGISPTFVGRVYLQGMTLSKAREVLTQKYAKAYGTDNTKVEISLNYYKLIQVNIVGEVLNPGSYTFSAMNSAFNALVAVDGPNQIGSVRNIFIKRDGQTIGELDLYDYLLNPTNSQNVFLYENDFIFVPLQGSIVSIAGAVRRPLKYEMKENESVADLIKYAGGLNENAYTKNVLLRRFDENQEVFLELNLDSLTQNQSSFLLQNGDSLFFKSIQADQGNFVKMGGAVRVPGNYVINSGDRIADVLFRAGGPTENAALDKAYLIRNNNVVVQKFYTFNVSKVLVNQNNGDNLLLESTDSIYLIAKDSSRQFFPVTITGEVNNPGEYQYGENLRLGDLILLAGDFKREAVNSQLEVSRILELSSENPTKGERILIKRLEVGKDLAIDPVESDFLLEPFDRIYIRRSPNFELQQSVVILGEVQYPGEYSLINKKERINSLVKRAGGTTEFAFKSATRLKRVEQGPILVDLDKVDNIPNSNYNYILANKDTIFVPKMYNYVTLKGNLKYFELDSTTTQVNVPYEEGKSGPYYVRKYGGGYSKFTNPRSTFVTQPNGEVQRASQRVVFPGGPRVDNGATVTVMTKDRKRLEEERIDLFKKKNFSWNRAIDSFASALISMLTIVVLILQIRS